MCNKRYSLWELVSGARGKYLELSGKGLKHSELLLYGVVVNRITLICPRFDVDCTIIDLNCLDESGET